jgi:hypothetical protein
MEGRDVAGPSASGGPEHQPSEGKRLDRLLVATDGSSRSKHAIRFAVELASEHQSEVLFVHVIPMVEGAPLGPARCGTQSCRRRPNTIRPCWTTQPLSREIAVLLPGAPF